MYSDAAFIARHSTTVMSGCWIWTGQRNSWGYGRVGRRPDRGQRAAHRLSYQTFRGPIPEDMKVLHTCDTPACVNPAHLFLGTNADNMRDMVSKDRANVKRGEANPLAKLTVAAVQEIRATKIVRGSISSLAREYGVSRRAISFALRGESWAR